jgi:hypothetical protein
VVQVHVSSTGLLFQLHFNVIQRRIRHEHGASSSSTGGLIT